MRQKRKELKVKEKIINSINRILNILYDRAPELLLGREKDWKIKLYSQYGGLLSQKCMEDSIGKERKALLAKYLVIATVCAVLFIFFLVTATGGKAMTQLARPQFGQPADRVPLEAELSYQGKRYQKQVEFSVGPALLKEKEQRAMLDAVAMDLPRNILGENSSLKAVCTPLQLPEEDVRTGVRIRWECDDPKRIGADGFVCTLGIQEPKLVLLLARLQLGQQRKEVYIPVTIVEPDEKKGHKASVYRSVEDRARELEEDKRDMSIRLPQKLGNGVSVTWHTPKESGSGEVVLLCLCLCGWFYSRRYTGIRRKLDRYRQELRRDFPEVVRQLVLLLNAGLVVSAALLEVADFSKQGSNMQSRPLFGKLAEIAQRAVTTNASFAKELLEFSQACGIRELIRFSVIVCDNEDKGSTLADKLEKEGDLLREQRKRRVEEQGRLAETRLSFPMMLLLLVLIMIAVAPVLLTV